MRRLCFMLALIGWIGVARADDPRAEMTAALLAAVDTHPAPAALPGTTAATKVAATPAAKHVPPSANLGRAAADQHGHDPVAAGLARQAQAAAQAAAGQAQAQAAKARAAHNPHH